MQAQTDKKTPSGNKSRAGIVTNGRYRPEHRKREYPAWQTFGRPMEYDENIAHEICTRIADGQPLRRILKDKHMPDNETVYRWLDRVRDFNARYTDARAKQAETYADEIIEIADNATDRDQAAAAKVQIHAREWYTGKIAPKKYGDLKQISIEDQRFAHLTDEQILQRIQAMAHQLGYSLHKMLPDDTVEGEVEQGEKAESPGNTGNVG